jgi:release factor glutamine methyltransferase
VEIDVVHHTTIIKNIQSNGISEHRSRIFGGNLFENITDQYDVILTNPPYINPHLSDRIGDDVLKFEPHLALFGGNDGMELIRTILTHIPRFLKPNGLLYIEHEPEQAEKIQELLPGIVSEKDQFDVVRFSVYQNT